MSAPDLPPLVSEYLRRAAPAEVALGGQVRLRQVGEMVLKPGARGSAAADPLPRLSSIELVQVRPEVTSGYLRGRIP